MRLSDRITAELRHELAQGHKAESYTLHALAARFGVSLTPVRLAVAVLEKSGHLVKQANGRLTPAKKMPRTPAPPPKDPTADAVEEKIRRTIVETSLIRAEPEFFREEESSARFGVGRTVLRRLFFRMAGEGLLEHVPRRGWRSQPVSDADLAAFVRVRELLEPEALRLAWDKLDRAFLAEVRAGNAPGAPGRPPRLDNRLHGHWIGRCGNRHIADFFARQGAAYASLFDYAALDRATAAAMARQHQAILDAILAGDQGAAYRAIVDHARSQLVNARKLRRRLAAAHAAPPRRPR